MHWEWTLANGHWHTCRTTFSRIASLSHHRVKLKGTLRKMSQDLVFIRESTGQRKFIFLHILRSGSEIIPHLLLKKIILKYCMFMLYGTQSVSGQCSNFMFPENVRKPKFFSCLTWYGNGTVCILYIKLWWRFLVYGNQSINLLWLLCNWDLLHERVKFMSFWNLLFESILQGTECKILIISLSAITLN